MVIPSSSSNSSKFILFRIRPVAREKGTSEILVDDVMLSAEDWATDQAILKYYYNYYCCYINDVYRMACRFHTKKTKIADIPND